MAGSHLLRWSGNPLENFAWWIRLNQIWGAFLPALGNEICLPLRSAREGDALPALHAPPPDGLPAISEGRASHRSFAIGE